MSELDDLLRQRAEIDARIEHVKIEEVERLKHQLAEVVTMLHGLNSLPKPLVELFTDKAGTFNAYRVVRVRKIES